MNDKLKVSYVPVSSIKFADYNPRKWSSESIESLKKSLQENGFVDPVILNGAPNRKDILIGGHFRVKVFEGNGSLRVLLLAGGQGFEPR